MLDLNKTSEPPQHDFNHFSKVTEENGSMLGVFLIFWGLSQGPLSSQMSSLTFLDMDEIECGHSLDLGRN